MVEGERPGIDFERLAAEASEFGASIFKPETAARRRSDDRLLRVSWADSAAFWAWLAAHGGVWPLRLVDLTAIDWSGSERAGADGSGERGTRFEIVYSFQIEPTLQRFRVCVDAEESLAPGNSPSPSPSLPPPPPAPPRVESVTRHWPAADWLEREVFDLFGIDFVGHPDLRRILLGSDFEGAPLRKDVRRAKPGAAVGEGA